MISVYDTLTRSKRELLPRVPGRVDIYVCGVTPYDDAHVGHARPGVFWDVVRRFLEYRGYRVRIVQNFTDIDDKIIARAREMNLDPLELSRRYARRYQEDMAALGVLPVDHYPRVSDHIPEIVAFVERLIEKGFAYESQGDVYFDVGKFPAYGKLSGRSREELKAGARVEVGEHKRNPEDFALWKAAKAGEPAWPSPWGPGRPGWHIECSAMALHYLGNGFDLHGGGLELVFPHHENEIAQSEAYTGQAPFVRYWVHNGLVTMREEKMSKSLKNFVTLRELLQHYPAAAIRLFLLSAHYRVPLEFTPDRVEEAARAQARLQNAAEGLQRVLSASVPWNEGGREAALELAEVAGKVRERFIAAMDDDFNTPQALAALFDLARQVNSAITLLERGGAMPLEGEVRAACGQAGEIMRELGDILGVWGSQEPAKAAAAPAEGAPMKDVPVKELVDLLLEVRGKARERKDWLLADAVRDGLQRLGFEVQDTGAGTRWRWLGTDSGRSPD